MSGIFISYRREDSRADAGRLAQELKTYFGKEQIFRDIDTIEPGVDFNLAIQRSVGACNALLAIIGPYWLSIKDDTGRRRIDDRSDYVRLEIETALSRDIRVVPLLVGGAAMPRGADLPESLGPLARRHSHELSDARWDYDVERLAAALATIPGLRRLGVNGKEPNAPTQRTGLPAKRLGVFAGASVLSACGVIFLLAGIIEGQGLALFYAAAFLGGAYWLFSKR